MDNKNPKSVPASPLMLPIYTIGYATKPIDVFLTQLQQHAINVIADVRSVPYSKIFHDYHREALAQRLKQHNFQYVYLGEELGPRSKDPCHYDHNRQVQFDKLRQAPLFKQGLERLQLGVNKGYNIALLCAEKDPAACHRSLLIGYALKHEYEIELTHIRHDGLLEYQATLENRITEECGAGVDLFLTEEEVGQQAYQERLKQTSYCKPE